MDFTNVVASKYLAAVDIMTYEPVHAVCGDVYETKIASTGEVKLVLTITNLDKDLMLNKTNSTTLVNMFGTESNVWVDRDIALVTEQVEVNGVVRPAIRIQAYIAPTATTSKAPSANALNA